MTEVRKLITVVCYANYCRSPVAEKLLQRKFLNYFEVISAGLNPLYGKNMDPRSLDFLKKKNISSSIHSPQKITNKIIQTSEIIFAIDTEILIKLNKLFPKYKQKIKLFSFNSPSVRIYDPHIMNDKEYEREMLKIESIVNEIEFPFN